MKKLVIANWKMSITQSGVSRFMAAFKNPKPSKVEVGVAMPSVYLLGSKNKQFVKAAQAVSSHAAGAYTGEISAHMLKGAGVKYCLVGHSEQRIYWEEDDQKVNSRLTRLLEQKITPVLCVGETAGERKNGSTVKVLTKQIVEGLRGVKDVSKIVIAYEPVWAISGFQKSKKKVSATDAQIATIHAWLRKFLVNKYGIAGKKIKLLYGGSVNPDNSKSFLNFLDVDGALVGAASLEAKSLMSIIKNIK